MTVYLDNIRYTHTVFNNGGDGKYKEAQILPVRHAKLRYACNKSFVLDDAKDGTLVHTENLKDVWVNSNRRKTPTLKVNYYPRCTSVVPTATANLNKTKLSKVLAAMLAKNGVPPKYLMVPDFEYFDTKKDNKQFSTQITLAFTVKTYVYLTFSGLFVENHNF